MRNSIGQEIEVGDKVLHVSRHGSHMTFKVGRVTGFGERQRYYQRQPEVTVLADWENAISASRGVGLDKVFKLAVD